LPAQADLVTDLYFGRDDAERDMAEGLLRAGFRPTRAYTAVLSGRKTLVIGRKGSGKSAICMQLLQAGTRAGGTVLVAPDDAAGDELRRFELQGLNPQTAKSLIWRYVFAVQAAQYLVQHSKDHGQKPPASVKVLGRFLKANGESQNERFYDRVLSGARKLQEASFSLTALGVTGSIDLKGQAEGAKAAKQLDAIEKGVSRALADLACAGNHEPFLILVDKVEEVWTGDDDSKAMVMGLLLAGHHVAGTIYGGALRCALFLRSDIYDALEYTETDKFHSDEIRIDWTSSELSEVGLARARASLSPDLTSDQLWTEVFPPRVDGEEIRSYLFRRALPRPRDVIQFLNQCKDRAADRGAHRISEQDVRDATRQFSEWKLLDLGREYQVNFPFLAKLFVMFENFGYIVTRQSLERRIRTHEASLRRQFPDYANAFVVDGVLGVLYGIGFLGVKRGNDVVYAGGAHAGIQPSESEFHIHPCFRSALHALDASDIHAYQVAVDIAQGTQVGDQNVQLHYFGRDVAFSPGRDQYLLDALTGSCGRILDLLGRLDMPAEARAQVRDELAKILSSTARQRDALAQGNGAVTASGHIVQAADYLNRLATQLGQNGMADSEGGTSLIRLLQTEARRLIRLVGGASNSS
jgi:ABC-type hemin transport system ATPase subunit